MAYDILAESQRLIIDGPPAKPVRLSRRRRFAAVAVDVDGDIAATRFVRRGVGCFWDEVHLLVRDHGAWRVQGGGGGSGDQPWATDEFERERIRLPHGHVEVNGGASVVRDGDRLLPWGARWVYSAALLAGPGVAAVVVDGRRELAVPYHGHLVVVWGARRPPGVSARDSEGRELSAVVVPRH